MKTIKARIRLENGNLLSAANAPLVSVRSIVATDRHGNSLAGLPIPGISRTPYFQRWVIRREPKGYIFREVSHGGGICGHHPSVRDLVIKTLFCLGDACVVEVEG